jgi:hypothetical protein
MQHRMSYDGYRCIAVPRTPPMLPTADVGWTTQRGKGGGVDAVRPGGESPCTNSPEDCLCMASAWGSVPRQRAELSTRRPWPAQRSNVTASSHPVDIGTIATGCTNSEAMLLGSSIQCLSQMTCAVVIPCHWANADRSRHHLLSMGGSSPHPGARGQWQPPPRGPGHCPHPHHARHHHASVGRP